MLKLETKNYEQIRSAWLLHSSPTRNQTWSDAMSWLLEHRPTYVPIAIVATYSDKQPGLTPAVLDCLEKLNTIIKGARSQSDLRREYAGLLVHVWNVMHVMDSKSLAKREQIRALEVATRDLAFNSRGAAEMFFARFTDGTFKMTPRVQLSLSRSLTMHTEYVKAFECLQGLVTFPEMEKHHISSLCNLILWHSSRQPFGYKTVSKHVETIVASGVEMDSYLYTTLMSIAIKIGRDFAAAEEIFKLLEQKNLQPTSHTWSIMLSGCKKYGTLEALERYLSRALAADLNDWAATDLIHGFWVYYEAHKSKGIYSALSRLYMRYYDPEPLRYLGILEVPPNWSPADAVCQYVPMPATIVVMLTAYLKQVSDPEIILQTYARFRELALGGKGQFVELASNSYMASAFLLAASPHVHMLQFCTDVISDMSEPLPYNIIASTASWGKYASPTTTKFARLCRGRGPKVPKDQKDPSSANLITWSILMHAFARHGQALAAQKVKKLMEQRGYVADQIVWNTLINAYTMAQDVVGLAGAYKEMREAGFDLNERSEHILTKIRDQRSLETAIKSVLGGTFARISSTPERTLPGFDSPWASRTNPESIGGGRMVKRNAEPNAQHNFSPVLTIGYDRRRPFPHTRVVEAQNADREHQTTELLVPNSGRESGIRPTPNPWNNYQEEKKPGARSYRPLDVLPIGDKNSRSFRRLGSKSFLRLALDLTARSADDKTLRPREPFPLTSMLP